MRQQAIFNDRASHKEDDKIDWLNHTVTTTLLFIFFVITTTEQYGGKPMKCVVDQSLTYSYVHSICWMENTYSVNTSSPTREHSPQLRYYQWFCVIFVVMACFYYVPCYFWRCANERSGLNLNNIIILGKQYHDHLESSDSRELVANLVQHFIRYFRKIKSQRGDSFLEKVSLYLRMNQLCLCYLACKLLYLGNSILQIVVVELLLSGGSVKIYGLTFMSSSRSNSVFFPKSAMCDYYAMNFGRTSYMEKRTVDCVLPINMFLENLLGIYWFWLVFLVVLNLFSTLKWSYFFLSKREKIRYINKLLKLETKCPTGDTVEVDRSTVNSFVENYLQCDGVFALRIISQNISDALAGHLDTDIFKSFMDQFGSQYETITSIYID